MMGLAEVAVLYESNASDIPAMLRMAADNIESGKTPLKSMVAVSVDEDGAIEVYGWGKTDSVDSLATLQLAVVKRSLAMLGEG